MEEIYSPTATDLIIKDLDHVFVDEGLSNVIIRILSLRMMEVLLSQILER